MIKFYKTENSKDLSIDFNEDMCEFIIISPDIQNDGDFDLENLKNEKILDSPCKIPNTTYKKSSEITMFLPKEFIVSENPFNKTHHHESFSPSPQNRVTTIKSIENFKYLDDEEIKNDSSDSSDLELSDDDDHSKEEVEEVKEKESDWNESEENEELLIKYKVKFPYSKAKNQEIWNLVKNWALINAKDEVRCENSHKNGGQICPDPVTVKNIRNIGKEMIKEIGRKIISGSFNLTTISFPIKSMIPKSALESIFQGSKFYRKRKIMSDICFISVFFSFIYQ